MLKRYFPALAVAVVLVALLLLAENLAAQSFNSCIDRWSAQQGPQEPHVYGRFVGTVIGSQSVCTLRFVNSHEGLFSALAAFVVAGFTFALWDSTEKLWMEAQRQRKDARRGAYANLIAARAARKSADVAEKTLLADMRPFLMIVDLTLRYSDEVDPKPRITFGWRNGGSKPIIIGKIGIFVGTFVPGQLASMQIHHDIKEVGGAIEALETQSDIVIKPTNIKTDDVVISIMTGKIGLQVTIEIAAHDVLKNDYPLVFPFLYHFREKRFVRSALPSEEGKESSDKKS